MKLSFGVAALTAGCIAGCGGGGGGGGGSSTPPGPHQVTISWAANHEKGVNSAGGGYRVSISGQSPIDVTYNGTLTPKSKVVTLTTGTYAVTVQAFAALDPQGGSTQTFSAPSQTLNVNVP